MTRRVGSQWFITHSIGMNSSQREQSFKFNPFVQSFQCTLILFLILFGVVVQRENVLIHFQTVVLDAVDFGFDPLDDFQRRPAAAFVERHVQTEIGAVAVDGTVADQATDFRNVHSADGRFHRAVPSAPHWTDLGKSFQLTFLLRPNTCVMT